MTDHAKALYKKADAILQTKDLAVNPTVLEFVARYHECKVGNSSFSKERVYNLLKVFQVKKELRNGILQMIRALGDPSAPPTYKPLQAHLDALREAHDSLDA